LHILKQCYCRIEIGILIQKGEEHKQTEKEAPVLSEMDGFFIFAVVVHYTVDQQDSILSPQCRSRHRHTNKPLQYLTAPIFCSQGDPTWPTLMFHSKIVTLKGYFTQKLKFFEAS